MPDHRPEPPEVRPHGWIGLLVFCAEQGFAGAFSERVLDSIEDDLSATSLFLIGTRGLSIAAARGAPSGLVRVNVLAHARHPETGR
jgi:F0F1-type ATP synthase gamma subunit